MNLVGVYMDTWEPGDVGALTGLTLLALSGRDIAQVPSGLAELTALQQLSLAGCSSMVLAGFAPLAELPPSVTLLDLSYCCHLPNLVSSLCGLREVRLQGVARGQPLELSLLRTLCSQLTALDISDCQLGRDLPPDLSPLTALRRLSMAGCMRARDTFTDELAALALLTSLDLSR